MISNGAMTILEVLLLAVALSADAFSVGAVVGLKACAPRQRFRLSFHFGVFQTLMPILGALLGRWALSYVQSYDHWIACGLLCLVGGKMAVEGWREKEKREEAPEAECRPGDPTRGWSLVGLSLATSIDAFGAGLGMAMVMELGFLLISVAIIGLVCGSITYLGMRAGAIIKKIAGKKIEIFGGLVLIGLGIRMLWI